MDPSYRIFSSPQNSNLSWLYYHKLGYIQIDTQGGCSYSKGLRVFEYKYNQNK